MRRTRVRIDPDDPNSLPTGKVDYGVLDGTGEREIALQQRQDNAEAMRQASRASSLPGSGHRPNRHGPPTSYDRLMEAGRHVDGIPVTLALQKRKDEFTDSAWWVLSWRTRYAPGGSNRRFYFAKGGGWKIPARDMLEMIDEIEAKGGLDERYFDLRAGFCLKTLVSTEMSSAEKADKLAELTGPDEDWGADPFFVINSDPNDDWRKVLIVNRDSRMATFRSLTRDPDYKPRRELRRGSGWWLDNSMMDANVQQTRAFRARLNEYLHPAGRTADRDCR